ncbi:hypothetical protein AQUCO_00300118v1 [Aquilegia coerulea]|uniref:Peptidase A1 domain-containing protein n=1 Tax=Aquilegia coerulea TaxID=218851 RepID=A0A2G5EXA9_AQUCA|nr:hypothetical protein AQUCO_00300118v1 [Aquilegia coerulea]
MASIYLIIYLMFLFLQSKLSLCSSFSSSPTLVLPLKIQVIPSPSRSLTKLSFHHNVSLTVSFSVGTPPQNVSMVIDTGSELSWFHCKKTPILKTTFDPLLSSSYSPIPCTSSTCKTQTKNFPIPVSCDSKKLCHTTLTYADFSSTEGNLAHETFHVGGSVVPGTVFGCMDQSSSIHEEDSKTTGLLGMNRGSLSFVSQMNFPKFSYCISDRDSSGVLLLGDSSLSWLKPLSYTPLIQITTPLPYFDRVAYTVQLEGIRVGTKVLPLPKSVFVPDHTGAGQTMIDSGTQFTYLLGPAYTALRNEFLEQTKTVLKVLDDSNYVFQQTMDLCYMVPINQANLPVLPSVGLMFGGAEMSVSGERLLYQVPNEVRAGNSIYCFTFGNSDLLGTEAYIIGHHHQHNMWVEFDLKNSRMGIASIRCDLASQKLGMSQ